MSVNWHRKDKVGGTGVLSGDCLSTDTKPTTVTVGSTLIETDTGDKYEFRGATAGWIQTSFGGAVNFASAAGGASDASGSLPLGEAVAVTETLTKIAELNIAGKAFIEIAVATNALDQFEVRAKAPSGSEQTLFSTAADFTSPSGILVGASGDLTTQAVGSGWLILEPTGTILLYAASGNVAGSSVTVYG